MKETRITCDVCKKLKNESNKWFEIGVARPEGLHKGSIEIIPAGGTFSNLPDDARDLCGEACALVMVHRWMSTGNLDQIEIR